jgi:hypothetical protein
LPDSQVTGRDYTGDGYLWTRLVSKLNTHKIAFILTVLGIRNVDVVNCEVNMTNEVTYSVTSSVRPWDYA